MKLENKLRMAKGLLLYEKCYYVNKIEWISHMENKTIRKEKNNCRNPFNTNSIDFRFFCKCELIWENCKQPHGYRMVSTKTDSSNECLKTWMLSMKTHFNLELTNENIPKHLPKFMHELLQTFSNFKRKCTKGRGVYTIFYFF